MFEFDITTCVVEMIPFECNGAEYINICIKHDGGEINYEVRNADVDYKPP